MNKNSLISALIALAVVLPADSYAKGRIRSSHSHGSSESHSSHATETHASESGSGFVRSAVARSNRSDGSSSADGSSASPGTPLTAEEDANLRRIRQEKEAARAKRDAEALAARKLQQAADEEKRRELAEQAAIARAEEQKRKDAAAVAKNRELALLERQQRQAAWEARCQIKAVMSDEEIATCKEVWSTPAR